MVLCLIHIHFLYKQYFKVKTFLVVNVPPIAHVKRNQVSLPVVSAIFIVYHLYVILFMNLKCHSRFFFLVLNSLPRKNLFLGNI